MYYCSIKKAEAFKEESTKICKSMFRLELSLLPDAAWLKLRDGDEMRVPVSHLLQVWDHWSYQADLENIFPFDIVEEVINDLKTEKKLPTNVNLVQKFDEDEDGNYYLVIFIPKA